MNEFKIRNGLIVVGNETVTGSITATGPVSASFFYGTASWAVSASWAPTNFVGGTISTGSTYPITASWALNTLQSNISTASLFASQSNFAVSASWASSSFSASYFSGSGTGSFSGLFYGAFTGSVFGTASQSVSASWAPVQFVGGTMATGSTYPITASWAGFSLQSNIATSSLFASQSVFSVSSSWASSSLTASVSPYAVASTSAPYYIPLVASTGSQAQGEYLTSSLFFNPALGSLVAPSITASLFGTASQAISASWSPVQFVGGTMVTGSTYPITSSWAVFSGQASVASSSLFASQSNFSTGSVSASFVGVSSTSLNQNYFVALIGSGSVVPNYQSINTSGVGTGLVYNPALQSLTIQSVTGSLWGKQCFGVWNHWNC